jgi:hypothetical protein
VRHAATIGDAMVRAMVRAMVETAAPGAGERGVRSGHGRGYRRGTIPPAMHFWSGADPVATGWPAWGYRPQAPRVLQDGRLRELISNPVRTIAQDARIDKHSTYGSLEAG